MDRKIKVAYVCVHNSCRSQMAEALTKLYHDDFFEAYSEEQKRVLKLIKMPFALLNNFIMSI